MAQLIVSDLNEEVMQALQRQAAAHGRSMEAEIRDILTKHLSGVHLTRRSFKDVMASMPYSPEDEDLFNAR